MTAETIPVRRALISVTDKAGLVELARSLHDLGVELVSSGGTAAALRSAGIETTDVAEVTGSPEILGGRVKTLHPRVHGGILADRSDPAHRAEMDAHGIEAFDLVVCNLYSFADAQAIENIDIGGVALMRAAAKNHAWVGVVADPGEYTPLVDELRREGGLTAATRRRLAARAFAHTAVYDSSIAAWIADDHDDLPPFLALGLERAAALRYGENPHQAAAFYRRVGQPGWWDRTHVLGGKELSFNNVADTDAAWRLACDLPGSGAAIIKHANPCGAAVAGDVAAAYVRALECDPVSAFGGVVALNRPASPAVAEALAEVFTEVVIAPDYEPSALEVLRARKNLRVLRAPPVAGSGLEVRSAAGGFLVQTSDQLSLEGWRVVTRREPTPQEWDDLRFAWTVCAHTRSNSIVLAKDGQAFGIGAGDQSRVGAAERAAVRAAGRVKGGVAASDAFFPFRDGLDACVDAGAVAVVQPGGSVRDDEVIAAADERGLAMVFTGRRHFRHA